MAGGEEGILHVWLAGCQSYYSIFKKFPPLELEVACVIVAVWVVQAVHVFIDFIDSCVWTVRQSWFYYDCV